MSLYQEILNWSQNRPLFTQDTLRRLIISSTLTQNDIDELIQLIKKEAGDTSITLSAIPLNSSHIPTTITANGTFPKLISLSNPTNISALHSQGELQFSRTGLTAIYGNNGSGKSSYSRILKKLCWSRNSNIELKKNVFNPSPNQQKVNFTIEYNGSNINIPWTENSPSNTLLNSIFVFDNDCGDIYINRENPTEYKPIGIDLLEKLILTFGKISEQLDSLTIPYNTQKPILSPELIQTNINRWYESIERSNKSSIESYIQFTQEDIKRKKRPNRFNH